MGRSFTINGKTFDPARTNITTKLGRVEEWTLTNTSTMDHPFHLHVWPFQVVARTDGAPITPGWKDTVNVPAGESVTVRVPLDRHRRTHRLPLPHPRPRRPRHDGRHPGQLRYHHTTPLTPPARMAQRGIGPVVQVIAGKDVR